MAETEASKSYSKFQEVILKVAREKLNLMLMEVCQLKEKIDFNDDKQLTCTVLEKIASNEIKSAHVTPEEAKNFLKLFKDCGKCRILGTSSFENPQDSQNTSSNSTFHDSPFS